MIWLGFYQFTIIILLLIMVKYILAGSELHVYEDLPTRKNSRSISSIDLYIRTLLKITGTLSSTTEIIYFVLLFLLSSLLLGLIPLFDNQIFVQMISSTRFKYEVLFIVGLMFFLSVITLLPPRRLLLALGKEYFSTKAMSSLLATFVIFIMSYAYSTFSFTELVIYQSTKSVIGLPNWGIFLNPILFLSYFATIIFNHKANLVKPSPDLYREGGYVLGLRAMHSMYLELMLIIHLLLIVTLFFGGYSLPYLDALLEFDEPYLTGLVQSIVMLSKMVILLFATKYIRRLVVLRSDFRFSKHKMMILFPLMIIGLLYMPILKYLVG